MHRLFHGSAQIASTHAELNGDITLIAFAIDLRAALSLLNLAELGQRNSRAGRREQADILDSLSSGAVLRQIAQHQVIALFALQDRCERIAAYRGLNRVLNVSDVDLITRRGVAINL